MCIAVLASRSIICAWHLLLNVFSLDVQVIWPILAREWHAGLRHVRLRQPKEASRAATSTRIILCLEVATARDSIWNSVRLSQFLADRMYISSDAQFRNFETWLAFPAHVAPLCINRRHESPLMGACGGLMVGRPKGEFPTMGSQ